MPLRRKLAFLLYGLVCLFSLVFGIIYTFAATIQPYHQTAIGISWDQLPAEQQTLLLALIHVAGGGWLALTVLVGALLLIPFRRGERWARTIIPIGILAFYLPTLGATLDVLRHTPSHPPWLGALAACVAAIVGFVLDMPWVTAADQAEKFDQVVKPSRRTIG